MRAAMSPATRARKQEQTLQKWFPSCDSKTTRARNLKRAPSTTHAPDACSESETTQPEVTTAPKGPSPQPVQDSSPQLEPCSKRRRTFEAFSKVDEEEAIKCENDGEEGVPAKLDGEAKIDEAEVSQCVLAGEDDDTVDDLEDAQLWDDASVPTDEPAERLRETYVSDVYRSFVVGTNSGKRPRPHQVRCVTRLLEAMRKRPDRVQNFLCQHSTGSGKSLTIACVAYHLLQLRDDSDGRFETVIVLNDRLQLDKQLGMTMHRFFRSLRAPSVVHVRSVAELRARLQHPYRGGQVLLSACVHVHVLVQTCARAHAACT